MRALKVAVVFMGVLIVGGVIVLFTVLAQRMSSGSGVIASVVLDEPAGTRIAGTSTAPDRLVVQLQGGGPDRVLVLDTKTGRVLGRVGLAR
ncbi:MAG: DUF6476 family protein [Janthinobacterium lividum]